AVALALFFALLCGAVASAGLHASAATAGLAAPALLGAILAVAAIAPRLRKHAIRTRRQFVALSIGAFAAAGFAWPLSFGIAVLLQGDQRTALMSLAPALVGLIVGAIAGALAGGVGAFVCCTRRAP